MPKSKVDGRLTRGAEILALFVLKESRSKMDAKAFLDDVTEVLLVPDNYDVMDAARKVLLVFGPLGTDLRCGIDKSTTTITSSAWSGPCRTVNSTPLPFGRASGQTWSVSPCALSSLVTHSGGPPDAGTRARGPDPAPSKYTKSSDPHEAPATPTLSAATIKGRPPRSEALLSVLPTKNPTHSGIGEKNGTSAPSVPRSGVARNWSSDLTHS